MELKNFFAQDDQGNLLGGATCYLYARGTENLAAGLQAANGTALANPFTADAKGLIQFAAPNGLYDLRVVKGPRDYRVRVQCLDVEESVAEAESAAGRAEVARDAAQLSAGVFADTAAGLAGTVSGKYFSVPSADSSEFLVLYRNNAGVAQEVKRYPSAGLAINAFAQWRAIDAEAINSTNYRQILDAIRVVRIVGGSTQRTYRLTVFCKNDATFGDRIQVNDELGNSWAFNGVAANKDAGPVVLTLTGATGTSFVLVVDYRAIASTGLILNSVSSLAFKFSPSIFAFTDIEASLSANISETTRLASREQKWWRDISASALTTPSWSEVQKAILAVRARNADATKTYRIVVVSKDHATFGDRIQINDALDNAWNFDGTAAGKANGPVWVSATRAGSSTSFDILIDYRAITTTGVALNVSGDYFKLSQQVLVFGGLADAIASANSSASAANDAASANTAAVADIRARFPKPWRDPSAPATSGTAHGQVLDAVMAVRAKNGDKTKTYKMVIVCKDDASLKDRLWIQDSPTTRTWSFEGTVAGKTDGPVWVTCTSAGSTTSFDVLVDYRKITTTGIILNITGDTFKLSPQIFEWDKLRAEFPSVAGVTPQSALARAIRVSVAGSSITWGEGWLGEGSYVGEVERYLRTVLATTLHGADFTLSGTNSTVSNKLFYKGSAVRLQGANAEASFDLYGDELSLCIARERGNAGAAQVEVYADGALLDTFTTWNDEAFATGLTANFTGDGTTRQFDLGQAFTFGHTVSVGGVAKVVQTNTGGYGASFPGGVDVLVIRKLVTVGGVPQVRHFLWFAVAPANGAAIVAGFSAGESVTYVRGTVGQTAQALTSSNESPYGDGNVAYDPANPANLSSGLGFRETDPRAVLTWHFGSTAKRAFKVRVIGLDPRATGTPQLYLNAATNRMHHLQNAGIGGWTAALLLNDAGLNNLAAVKRFQPDVLLFESCTNDDWQTHVDRAWRTRTGLTDAQVRGEESAHLFHSVTYVGTDNYTVEDNRLLISAITETSVQFDGAGATFEVVPGDVVILGDFKGDNRRLACRVVKAWDAANRRITWARPLSTRELAHITVLGDLVGSTAMVKGAPSWVANVEAVIDALQEAVPECVVAIGTAGIPNIRYRRLEGYRELAADIARRKGVLFEDIYARTLAWQYSQPATAQLYLNASQSTTSTGASEYTLYQADGAKPTATVERGWSVKVDGVERINRGCHIAGGYKTGWADGTSPMTLSNTTQLVSDYRVVFETDPPPAGSTIVVKRAAAKWSNDDCHPGTAGFQPFGKAAIAALTAAVVTAQGRFALKS
ncbi:hypothetical protein E5198_16465 [Pseudomonas sp. A-1]|uniref:hypothetical protein n=1 Tax=Pseudomonas sp. A-1 TaxID=1821274 RepID=UPI0010A69E77|nr:hypothetical protein [Pseudomonas sp. A-1]THG77762.1 hypothetical protein E5198_16465 [Pseudomonas sp. A-1]